MSSEIELQKLRMLAVQLEARVNGALRGSDRDQILARLAALKEGLNQLPEGKL